MITGLVRCDEPGCGWYADKQNIAVWHKQPCPRCGVSSIVSDADMAVLAAAQMAVDAGLLTQGDGKSLVNITIDTANMRGADK